MAKEQFVSSDEKFAFPYLLVGSGKLSKHLSFYFSNCGISFLRWSRKHSPIDELNELSEASKYILLAVKDDAIDKIKSQISLRDGQELVHFSGSRAFAGVKGLHPLASFSDRLFAPQEYKEVAFACHSGAEFSKIFPQLENPWFLLNENIQSDYHSLLSLATTSHYAVWNQLQAFFEKNSLPTQDLLTFYQSLQSNIQSSTPVATSGPIARGDLETNARNIQALRKSGLDRLYEALIKLYQSGKAN